MARQLARLGPRSIAWMLAGLVLLAALALGLAAWWLRAREVTLAPDWVATVRTIAGDGQRGTDDGPAARARFSEPFGVAVSGDTIYIADAGDAHRIRRLGPDDQVTTLAGGQAGFADGAGAAARFRTPSGLAVDRLGNIIVADTGNHAIRRVAPDGAVTTLAGNGTPGDRDGPGEQALFNGPIGVALDGAGRVIVADTYNDRIRAILPDGRVVTLAGAGRPGLRDGDATSAEFDTPSDVAVDATGTIYVADAGNDAVRAISPAGDVSTLVPAASGTGDSLWRPVGIDVSPAGTAYVTDARGQIVEIRPAPACGDSREGRRDSRKGPAARHGFASQPGSRGRQRAASSCPTASTRSCASSPARNRWVCSRRCRRASRRNSTSGGLGGFRSSGLWIPWPAPMRSPGPWARHAERPAAPVPSGFTPASTSGRPRGPSCEPSVT